MKRRSFIAAVGAAIAAPLSLLKAASPAKASAPLTTWKRTCVDQDGNLMRKDKFYGHWRVKITDNFTGEVQLEADTNGPIFLDDLPLHIGGEVHSMSVEVCKTFKELE